MTAPASKSGSRQSSRKSTFMPTVKKKRPSRRPLNGATVVSIALRYSVSASSNPATKAPSAIESRACSAITPSAMMTNKTAAMKTSVERAVATKRNSGRNKTRPKATMTIIAAAACNSAVARLASTEPPERAARIEIKSRIGMTARSCASRMEKLARPTLVVSRSWFDRSSSTIAVEESERALPSTTASDGLLDSASAAPAITALVSRTCNPPKPSTSRRMAESLENDSSRPIKNRRKTTPSSAMPATFCASVIVTQNRPGTTPASEPSPSGPKSAPAPR